MKKITTLTTAALFALLLLASSIAQEEPPTEPPLEPPPEEPQTTTEYTPTTKTVCDQNGACTLTLYSGIMQVYEDEEWKPIAEARSLLGYYNVVYLEKEDAFNIEVIDFNLTDIELETTFLGHPLDYPEFCTYKSEQEFKCQFKNNVKWDECIFDEELGEVCTEQTIKFDMKYEMKDGEIVANDTKFQYKGTVLDKKYTFGGNSTTIVLQDADTENLEDTFISIKNPNTNYGTAVYMQYLYTSSSGGSFEPMLKFDITQIPASQNIDSAILYVYSTTEFIDAGESYTVNAHHLYNTTWIETTPTWNNQGGLGDFNATAEDTWLIDGADPGPNSWYDYNVTNMVSKAYENSDENLSIWLKVTLTSGTPSDFDYVNCAPKETSVGADKKPYLQIIYFSAAAATCDCPASGHWQIADGSHCSLSTACSLDGNLHISNGSLAIVTGGELLIEKPHAVIIEGTGDANLIIQGGKLSILK